MYAFRWPPAKPLKTKGFERLRHVRSALSSDLLRPARGGQCGRTDRRQPGARRLVAERRGETLLAGVVTVLERRRCNAASPQRRLLAGNHADRADAWCKQRHRASRSGTARKLAPRRSITKAACQGYPPPAATASRRSRRCGLHRRRFLPCRWRLVADCAPSRRTCAQTTSAAGSVRRCPKWADMPRRR